MIVLTERKAMEAVLEFVIQGNAAQINDPAFVDELKQWIRFSGGEAVHTGDGLYAASSGNPAVPTWLGSLLFGLFFTPKSENDKYAKHLRSSAGIAIFVSDAPSPAQWVEVGRCSNASRSNRQRLAFAMQCSINLSRCRRSVRSLPASSGSDGAARSCRQVRARSETTASLRRPIQAVLV